MKVLVAIDDSKFSEAALQAVITQIRPGDADVRVLHGVAPLTESVPPHMAAGYAPELQDELKAGRELVERAAGTLRAAGFKANASVYKGDIREGILENAAQWRADLVVVGSHGRKGLTRFLLGSTAESVARHARCSVEIVRVPSPPTQKRSGHPLKVLLAIDDSKYSEAAVQTVIQHMRPEKTEVCILHVTESVYSEIALYSYVAHAQDIELVQQERLKQSKALVARAEQPLSGAGFQVRTEIRKGDQRTEITDCAAEWSADVIVVGSHGQKGLDRFLMGSVAEFVSRHAFCSVWIVRTAQPGLAKESAD
jgi:universal stress protein A